MPKDEKKKDKMQMLSVRIERTCMEKVDYLSTHHQISKSDWFKQAIMEKLRRQLG